MTVDNAQLAAEEQDMNGYRVAGVGGIALLLGCVALSWSDGGRAAELSRASGVQIGVLDSLFPDTPRASIPARVRPLKGLLDTQTGLNCELSVQDDACELGQALETGKVQLGVFHGVEFAWARTKYPNLKPLVVAVSAKALRAYLVVRKDSSVTSLADLEGKTVALPCRSRAHCHLYLEHLARGDGEHSRPRSSKIVKPKCLQIALDQVARGDVAAAIVDRSGLDWYREQRPSGYANLKIVQESQEFPPGVIAYCPGMVDENTLARVRSGLLTAGQTQRGATILECAQIKQFANASPDLDQALTQIVKAYPPPSGGK
jgi:ABC-type phosphate/phosphonate transport system substrate-binding protein